MDNIKKMLKLTSLYDLYKNLLTDKQRQYFEAYYFQNQSLKEVSEAFDVSRNAVYSQLNEIGKSLEDFEAKLHLKRKKEKINVLVDEIRNSETEEEREELLKKLERI